MVRYPIIFISIITYVWIKDCKKLGKNNLGKHTGKNNDVCSYFCYTVIDLYMEGLDA